MIFLILIFNSWLKFINLKLIDKQTESSNEFSMQYDPSSKETFNDKANLVEPSFASEY